MDQTQTGSQLTAAEQKAKDAWLARRKHAAPRLKFRGKKGGTSVIGTDHHDEAAGFALLMRAAGTDDEMFMSGLVSQIVSAAVKGQEMTADGEGKANFLLSVVKAIEPRDEIEAMLASQMAVIQAAMLAQARKLNHAEVVEQFEVYEKGLNRLARTFTAQVEALKRYRSRGEQTVRVEHVTVNEGGQAIVGNVATRGRAEK